MEAAHYRALLTENKRVEFLTQTYAEKVQLKAEAEAGIPKDVADEIAQMAGETPGQRVIAYIVKHDPSRNHQYSQWLVFRYLRGEFRLEDLAQVPEYLTVFERAKPRIEKRDINQYKDFAELWKAIKPFLDGSEAVSANQEKRDFRARLRDDDQVQFVYDSPNLSICIPKTFEAACHYGVNTRWCTTQTVTRFESYSSQGPLYIILDKVNNRRWQFHFASEQFMDEEDHAINLREFFAEYPQVFRLFDERKWFPFADRIGLDMFSPEGLLALEDDKLSRKIKTLDDIMALPKEKIMRQEFARAVLVNFNDAGLRGQEIAEYRKIINCFLTLYPDEFFNHLVATGEKNSLLNSLPPRFHTDENKIAVANTIAYTGIEFLVPKPWPQAVVDRYWRTKVSLDSYVRLKEIPDRYVTPKAVASCLARWPDDIKPNVARITQEIAHDMAERNSEVIERLPEKFLDQRMAEIVLEWVERRGEHRFDETYKLFERFDPSTWPDQIVEAMFSRGFAKNVTWDKLPANLRTPHNIDLWINSDSLNILRVPIAEMTNSRVYLALKSAYSSDKAIMQKLPPEVLTDELLADIFAEKYGDFFTYSHTFEAVPVRLRTHRVCKALMDCNDLRIADVPKELLTRKYILQHLPGRPGEFDDVPIRMIDAELGAELVERVPALVAKMPKAIYSEPMLYAYLSKFPQTYNDRKVAHDDKEEVINFKRFPKSMWSQRVVAKAIERDILPPDYEVPHEFLDQDGAAGLMARTPEAIKSLPENLVNEETLTKAAHKNIRVLDVIAPEQITEPVIYAVLDRWAGTYKLYGKPTDYSGSWNEDLDKLPKEKFSQRCWDEAAGSMVRLKDVPSQFRTPELVRLAIIRDPHNITALSDPAGWMNANTPNVDGQWRMKMDDIGVILVGKNYIDVNDLDKKPLESGGSYVVIPNGTKNLRVFIFDKHGKIAGRFETERNEVVIPYVKDYNWPRYDMRGLRKQIAEIVRKEEGVRKFGIKNLNQHGVYTDGSEDELPREKIDPKGKLTWSEVEHGGGLMWIGWLGDTPVLRLLRDRPSHRNYGHENHGSLVSSETLVSPEKLMPLNQEILRMLETKHVPVGWSQALRDIGIYHEGNSWRSLFDHKVADLGEMQVYRANRRVTVFSKKLGELGHGTLRNNGRIEKIEIGYPYSEFGERPELEPVIQKVFATLQEKIPVG